MSDWYTATALAGLPGMRGSPARTRELLKRLGVPSRPRSGPGGGMEFNGALLPAETRAALVAGSLVVAPAVSVPVRRGTLRLKTATQTTVAQQKCADARAALVERLQLELDRGTKLKAAARALAAEIREAAEVEPELATIARCANARARADGTVSDRALRDWFAMYAAQGWAGLVPKPASRADTQLAPDVAAVLATHMSASGAARNLTTCVRSVMGDLGLPADQFDGLYHRALRALKTKVPRVQLIKARHRGAERDAKLPFKRRDTTVLRPNDVWVGDGHTFKAKVRHPVHGAPFAPEVTLHMDAATRMVVGWSVALSESTIAVGDALRHAVGRHGVPAVLYTDRGSGETAKAFDCPIDGLAVRLGIDHRTGLPGKPQGHGLIERSWRTHMINCARQFGSYQGDDADSRTVRDVRLALDREQRAVRRGEVVSLHRAAPSWAQFMEAVGKAVEAYNTQHRHRSLPRHASGPLQGKRMTPAEAWAHMVDPALIVTVEPQDLRHLFMPAVLRVPQRGEVALFNQRYFNEALMQVDGQQCSVRYDIHDASLVQVWTLDGRFVCEAKWDANRIDYFPKPVIEIARERRVRAAQKRLEQKSQLAAAELRPVLEAPVQPLVDLAPLMPALQVQPEPAPVAASTADSRPVFFESPADRYEWLMRHRDAWSAADAQWVQAYASGPEYQRLAEYFAGRGLSWSVDPPAFNQAG